jgi:hypothetical protein
VKVRIETDEMWPDYIVQSPNPDAEGKWDADHTYEVPEAQVEVWRRAEAAYAQRNAEIRAMIARSWKNGKRVDLEDPPAKA